MNRSMRELERQVEIIPQFYQKLMASGKKSAQALAMGSGIDEQYAVHDGCARQQQRRCQDAGAERS